MNNTDPTSTSSPIPGRRRWNTRHTMASVAIATAGLAGGIVFGSTMSAGAATTSAPASSSASTGASTSAATAPSGTVAPYGGAGWGGAGPRHALGLTGTVTAVGATSVTVKTSSATTTYAVTSTSDIDKNGEAKLSDLVVGDTVTFNVTSATTPTIDKLHAGDEALDRPTGPGGSGGWGYGPGGQESPGGSAAG